MMTGIFPMKEFDCLWKQSGTSVLYDDDCMVACGSLGIHDTKSVGFTFRRFM